MRHVSKWFLVAGIQPHTLVNYQMLSNLPRERSWLKRDTESLETLETSGVILWETT